MKTFTRVPLFIGLVIASLIAAPAAAQEPPGRTFSTEYPELLKKAQKEFQAGRPEKAMALLDKAIAIAPEAPAGYYYKAIVSYAVRKYQESSTLFRTAFLKSGRDGRMMRQVERMTSEHANAEHARRFQLGFRAIEEKKYAEAEKIFTELIRENPANALYYYELGYARVELKKFTRALNDFRMGALRNPLSYKMYSEIKFVQSELGDVDGLRGTIQGMRPLFGDRPQYNQELAFALARKKRAPEAIKLLKQNVAKFPDFASSYFMLGQLHIIHLKDCAAGKRYFDLFSKTITESMKRYKFKVNVPEMLKRASQLLRGCDKPAKV